MTYQDYYGYQAPNPNFWDSGPRMQNRADWAAMPMSEGMQYLDTQRKVRDKTRQLSEKAMLQKSNDDLALLLAFENPAWGGRPGGPDFHPPAGQRINFDATPTNQAEFNLQALINRYRVGQDAGFSRGYKSELENEARARQQAKENLDYQAKLAQVKAQQENADRLDWQFQQTLEEKQAKRLGTEDYRNRGLDIKQQTADAKAAGLKLGKLPTYHDLAQGIQAGVIPDEATLASFPNAQLSSDQWTSLLGQLGRKQKEIIDQDVGVINPVLKQLNDTYQDMVKSGQKAVDKAGALVFPIPFDGKDANIFNREKRAATAQEAMNTQLNNYVNTALNGSDRLRESVAFDPATKTFVRRTLPTDRVDAIAYANSTPYVPPQLVPPPVRQAPAPQYGPWPVQPAYQPTGQMFQPTAPVVAPASSMTPQTQLQQMGGHPVVNTPQEWGMIPSGTQAWVMRQGRLVLVKKK